MDKSNNGKTLKRVQWSRKIVGDELIIILNFYKITLLEQNTNENTLITTFLTLLSLGRHKQKKKLKFGKNDEGGLALIVIALNAYPYFMFVYDFTHLY